MINKDHYIEILSKVLNRHYDDIKQTGIESIERQQYIEGYLTAARALDAFDYKELKEVIDRIHFKAFGKTTDEKRRRIPTYIRKGITLDEE
jgi:hypothetical protein